MAYKKSKAIIQARMSFIQQFYDKADNLPNDSYFSMKAFSIVANLGLQIPVKKEDLFTNDNEINPDLERDEFKKKLKDFLIRYIK